MIDVIAGLSRRAPLLVLIEDAHWIDPTTEEWIGLAVDGLRDARVLMLVTCRPEYVPSWGNPVNSTRLTMNRLSHRQSAALIGSVAGKALPMEVIDEIIRKTDGVPLFVEELTKTVLASALVEDTPDGLPAARSSADAGDSFDVAGFADGAAGPAGARQGDRAGRQPPSGAISATGCSREVLQMPAAAGSTRRWTSCCARSWSFRRGTPADAGYASSMR